MINSVEVYREAGKEVALAMKNKDVARAKHVIRWVSDMKAREDVGDRFTAEQAYVIGYGLECDSDLTTQKTNISTEVKINDQA